MIESHPSLADRSPDDEYCETVKMLTKEGQRGSSNPTMNQNINIYNKTLNKVTAEQVFPPKKFLSPLKIGLIWNPHST